MEYRARGRIHVQGSKMKTGKEKMHRDQSKNKGEGRAKERG